MYLRTHMTLLQPSRAFLRPETSRQCTVRVRWRECMLGMCVPGIADSAYDSRADFQLLEGKGIRAGIRIKAGATRKSQGSSARPRAVRELRALGYEGWRESQDMNRIITRYGVNREKSSRAPRRGKWSAKVGVLALLDTAWFPPA